MSHTQSVPGKGTLPASHFTHWIPRQQWVLRSGTWNRRSPWSINVWKLGNHLYEYCFLWWKQFYILQSSTFLDVVLLCMILIKTWKGQVVFQVSQGIFIPFPRHFQNHTANPLCLVHFNCKVFVLHSPSQSCLSYFITLTKFLSHSSPCP